MAQPQHAQAHLDGVVLIGARDVDVRAAARRAGAIRSRHSRLQLQRATAALPASSNAVATSDTGSAGTTCADLSISMRAEPLDLGKAAAPRRACGNRCRARSTYWRSDTGAPKLTQA